MRALPPLTELRAFEAAARHLSFKLAAEELGVTPTAISHQVKLLEQHCGQLLFRRRPRPLSLTRAGEQLFPAIRDGFQRFSDALSGMRLGTTGRLLRITATNAFAARWLVPRLPRWQQAHPRLRLEIIGTDAVLDLAAGEADIAIRYCLKPPTDETWTELMRDRFHVVASPKLVGNKAKALTPAEIAELPLIDIEWSPDDTHAPTWRRWQQAARRQHRSAPDLASLASITFREELHAIEAAVRGQGVAICSDVLVAPELTSGALVPVSRVTLPGFGFYLVCRPGHRKESAIRAFLTWARNEP